MSDPETWHRRQLDTAEELLDDGQAVLHHGDARGAVDRVDEALVILDMARAEKTDDDVRRLRARALNDRGLLYQHDEDLERARRCHRRAAEIVEEIDEIDESFAVSAAAVYLNQGQVAIFEESYDRAREAIERASEIVEELRDRGIAEADSLALSIYQNESALESHSDNLDDAIDAAETAVELAEDLEDREVPEATGQAARVAQQLSVQLYEKGRVDAAVDWGERAESFSERAYENLGEEALHLYVVSQINLISFYEDKHRFADAEDCLWKAIDVAGPDPELLERGEAFYEQCRKYTDSRLEAGNLPRDEVEMGFEELQELMERHGYGSV